MSIIASYFPLRFALDTTQIKFIEKRHISFAIMIILSVISLVSLLSKELNLGIDFKGGVLIEARSTNEQTIDIANIRSHLNEFNLGDVNIQSVGSGNDVMINFQQQQTDELTNQATSEVNEYLEKEFEIRRVEFVGPKVGQELMQVGLIATTLAIAAIGLYVAFRFEWQFGIAALLTTFHDVFLTFGVFSIFHLEFNLTSIAALLTIAGYSINDTVIVFDRMRENFRKYKRKNIKDSINLSINQTLSRTILTSSTTLISIFPLLLFGGSNLYDFTFALTVGILIGTFSSIFVAAPLLLFMRPVREIITLDENDTSNKNVQDDINKNQI